jgi:hypothetical protein
MASVKAFEAGSRKADFQGRQTCLLASRRGEAARKNPAEALHLMSATQVRLAGSVYRKFSTSMMSLFNASSCV